MPEPGDGSGIRRCSGQPWWASPAFCATSWHCASASSIDVRSARESATSWATLVADVLELRDRDVLDADPGLRVHARLCRVDGRHHVERDRGERRCRLLVLGDLVRRGARARRHAATSPAPRRRAGWYSLLVAHFTNSSASSWFFVVAGMARFQRPEPARLVGLARPARGRSPSCPATCESSGSSRMEAATEASAHMADFRSLRAVQALVEAVRDRVALARASSRST